MPEIPSDFDALLTAEKSYVSNLPTFAGFVNGKLVKQAQGNKPEIIQEVRDEVAGY